MVLLGCMLFAYATFVLWCMFLGSETKAGRRMLTLGIIFAITANVLMLIWKLVYVYCLYDFKYWFDGYGDPEDKPYRAYTKTDYVISFSISTVIIILVLISMLFDTIEWTACASIEE